MSAAERFRLPPIRSGWSPRWVVASVLAHAVVLVVWVRTNPPRPVDFATRGPILLMDVPAEAREPLRGPAHPAAPRGGGPSRPLLLGRGVAPAPAVLPPLSAGRGADSAGGRGAGAAGRLTLADAVPHYGDGRLWVPPMWLPRDGGRPIRMDSIVATRMLALADSIERHPAADPNANPYVSRPWTFRRNGKTYGWDAAGLHLGDFTIPTVALAFLAFPQGNIDQSRANSALMAMRADILRAAARAQAEDDFKQAVRDIRARLQRERDQRQARDSARTRLTP